MKKKVTAKYDKERTAKWEKYERDKSKYKKVRKRTNVGASTEGKVEAAEGSTKAHRKDDNGLTEVRNSEEVPALM